MPIRYWTCHWQNRFWHPDINGEDGPVCHSAGNSFSKRGVAPGDIVYIVSILEGQLLLGGRMKVERILSYEEAVDFFDGEDIYEADEHLIGVEGSGTPLKLHRRLSPAVTKRIRFESKGGPKEPFFVSDTELDRQATRGVRELTSESAAYLDRIIAATDGLPYPEGFLTVTDALLGDSPLSATDAVFRIPEEVPLDAAFREGNVTRIEINRYERDREARVACIAFHGARCGICDFDFGTIYLLEFRQPQVAQRWASKSLTDMSEVTSPSPRSASI